MKIRSGFVSNSSSSSFVLQVGQKFSTVKEVASYILNACISDWGTENFEKLLIELNKVSSDTPVFFNTGGDYTYIRKVDDKIVLTTSDHVNVPDIYNSKLEDEDLSDDFFHQFDYIDKYMDTEEEITINCIEELHNLCKFHDFYSLQYAIEGRHTYLDIKNKCDGCGSSFSRAFKLKNGEVICNCKIEKYAKLLARKQKLKKIENNLNKEN